MDPLQAKFVTLPLPFYGGNQLQLGFLMVDVVEIEVLRAREWLCARRRAHERQRAGVFRRVRAQMAFADLRRELRRAEDEDEDEDADLALDFLSDVNADDMSALLRAEAATGAAVAASTVTTASQPPLKPIDMPPNLMGPRRVASNGFGLAVGGTAPTGAVEARKSAGGGLLSLASDDHVDELMQDLQLDLHGASSDDERKTEESTPPQLAAVRKDPADKDRIDVNGGAGEVRKANGFKAKKSNGIEEKKTNGVTPAQSKQSSNAEKPAAQDAVASEMLSWVSGVRDPTVLSKKESLAKRKRRRTHQYGVANAEEQRYVQESVKHYTGASDSEDMSPASDNDYSPSEDPPEFDPDDQLDPNEVLTDDNSDSEQKKLKKRRLKKKATPPEKKGPPLATPKEPRQQSASSLAPASARGGTKPPSASRAKIITISDDSDDEENDQSIGNKIGKHARGANGLPLHVAPAKSLAPQRNNGTQSQTTSATTAVDEGYETPELDSDGEMGNANKPTTPSKAKTLSATTQPDDDASETETVDFDFDGGIGEDQSDEVDPTVTNAKDQEKTNQDDVSDAETVVLDGGEEGDEEGEVRSDDDLGLDYSDDSDDAPLSSAFKKSSSAETVSSAPGVVQFFDMAPLRPRKRVETRKVIPVHSESEFMKNKKQPSTSSGVDKDSVKLNGDRQTNTASAHTSTAMKGNHPVIRRAIKMMDDDDDHIRGGSKPRPAGAAKESFPNAGGANVRPTAANGLRKTTHSAQRASSRKETDDSGTSRYLSYSNGKGSASNSDPKTVKAKPTPTVTPSRFGGGGGGGNYGVNGVGGSSTTTAKQYSRDPQMSLYDALHIDGDEESASYMDRDSGFKRPTAFKKLQAESVRTGVPIVTSKAKEPDWDRIPIPKKGIAFTSGVPEPRPPKSTKKKEKPVESEKPSHYGPGAQPRIKSKENYRPDYDKSKHRGRGADNSRYQPQKYDSSRHRNNERRRSTSPTPTRRGDSRYRSNDNNSGRSSYGDSKYRRSRSPSPRSKDRERERDRNGRDGYQRSRSPSPAWKRQRVDEWSSYKAEKDPRRRSKSPPRSDMNSSAHSNSKSDANGYNDESSTKQKWSEPGQIHPSLDGGLASFDDGDEFVSDSDHEIEIEMEKEQEDIRYDLMSVKIDPNLIARRVYVTDLNPAICAEELEEEMAPFGLAVCFVGGDRLETTGNVMCCICACSR